jgi:hypothetical protein
VQFPLVHRIVERAVPNGTLGIVPALFAAAPLLSMFAVHRGATIDGRAR